MFGFGEQEFYPDTALAVRFLVGFGRMVRSDPIQIVLMGTAAERPSLLTGGTLPFERAVIAILCACSIAERSVGRMRLIKMEFFASRTDVDITLGIVLELLRAKELGAMIVIRQGNVGMDMLAFDSNNVLFGAILAVPGGLPRPQLPPKARPPEQVEHGFVFRDF